MIISIPKVYTLPPACASSPFVSALRGAPPPTERSVFAARAADLAKGHDAPPLLNLRPLGSATDQLVDLELRTHVLHLLFREIDAHVESGQNAVCMNLARNLEIGIFLYSQGKERNYKKKSYFIACMMRRAGRYIMTHVDSLWKIVSVEPSKIVFSWNVKRGRMGRDGEGRVLTGGTLETMGVFNEMEESIRRIYSRTIEENGGDAKKETFKCAKCGFNKCVGYRYQNRSGDEGMAYYIICLGCGVKTSAKR